MKKTVLTGLFTSGFALGVMGQYFSVDDLLNTSTSPTATTNGLIWELPAGLSAPILATNQTLHATVFAGSSPSTLQLVVSVNTPTISTADLQLDYANAGQYHDDSGDTYMVPGVASSAAAFFQIQVWEGNETTFLAAQQDGRYAGESAIFEQATASPTSANLPDLTGMPAVVLTIPEPGAFALAGLGAAALRIFRRPR